MKRSVQIAEQAGYCFGVRRALDMVKEHLTGHDKRVYSLGPIIHNPQVVEEFRKRGLTPVESLASVSEGVLVIRSHGVEKELLEEAHRKGLEVVDATCPFVKNAQRLARQLSEDGYQVLIVGEEAHPEVKGILSYCGENTLVVSSVEHLEGKAISPKAGILAQTTQSQERFIKIVHAVLLVAYECRVFNTICNATLARQTAAVELAGAVDVMFVIGGRNSANTARLAELCRAGGTTTYHIETADEIMPEMVSGKQRIGITAGASTPSTHIEAVQKRLEQIDG
ncbi:MAG: 4-hydroxy-3-methylbut-2-enyl diphosphate reductase [Candidatus Abyssobacteria bacterium SURF_17]|jgi:4-hydroxy-3-methylbut-2-enyl diphosphate reductase|uniref:4-hydroxy-3-methylbut-2-enyl diphosphate reductase n=1 Tax=Candidatus Abyssobacteria bacterium SURF_17 TaxID=2093361 RepID=A0A419F015_9BACT|nr:MAG: 4-hydroxy-3-methylbut-2-enyl diphosphate reductase [Candidatus Abyssubacteria bacterium SURF_17]